MKKLTLEQIEKNISEFYRYKGIDEESPFIQHFQWQDENGHYSSWKIGKGLHTGDGGYEEYCKALEKAIEDKGYATLKNQ